MAKRFNRGTPRYDGNAGGRGKIDRRDSEMSFAKHATQAGTERDPLRRRDGTPGVLPNGAPMRGGIRL